MRVVSGKYGSRPLKAVPGTNTRPTTDKIKESMFNLLAGNPIQDKKVLDFYGGSGALGIEAVSRGADQAVICEKHRAAIKVIQENILMTKELERFTLLPGNNHSALKQFIQSHQGFLFDFIFLDPPYAKEAIIQDIKFLISMDCLNDGALIICESDAATELPEQIDNFTLVKDKTYGISRIRIYKKGDQYE